MHAVGIIGGGQLAAMTAPFAKQFGVEFVVQTPNFDDPAAPLGTDVVLGAIADLAATDKLSDRVQVITFENEFIDLAGLQQLADRGVCFRPSLAALAPLLDKYDQRCYLQKIGLPVPSFGLLNPETVGAIATQFGFPVVLKARRHGYDGRGTFIVESETEMQQLWQNLGQPELLVEKFIPFERELAVMAARSVKGEMVVYPVVETQQQEQVCRRVIAPANVSAIVVQQTQTAAETLLNALDVVGIFGIELFLTQDGQILVNEIAPRTHNSGHYTLDACNVSQFEMHLRAVMGQPLPQPKLQCSGAVMVNLLGYEDSTSDYAEVRAAIAARPQTFVHWYNKTAARPGRKLGHATTLLTSKNQAETEAIAAQIETLWYGQTSN
ncbi:MAG: 5-(carboxyamino)imidazole ribonucleotide synthase [Spirulina sp. SIO3F2]|nr:5-(carboxyamino)imidazole ribonucleotide synthase [Spirulina sp. SIO3F2]